MPSIATLEQLRQLQRDLAEIEESYPDAYKAMSDLIKKHTIIGYKNICKLLTKRATPESLKKER